MEEHPVMALQGLLLQFLIIVCTCVCTCFVHTCLALCSVSQIE